MDQAARYTMERMLRRRTSISVRRVSICWKRPTCTPKALRERAWATASSMAAWAMPKLEAHKSTRPYSSR